MSDTLTHEERVKLAELAGYEKNVHTKDQRRSWIDMHEGWKDTGPRICVSGDGIPLTTWHPESSLDQARECVNALVGEQRTHVFLRVAKMHDLYPFDTLANSAELLMVAAPQICRAILEVIGNGH